jgi:myo-inositol-1(or 4)-monophosphatase
VTIISPDDDLHQVALAAARAGVAAIRTVSRDRLDVRAKSGVEDFVTVADHAAEAAILAVIGQARPHDEIIAEESGSRAGSSGVRWHIDPVDGTANFIAGNPDHAVSIAAEQAGSTVAAVVYRPADDRWLASTGRPDARYGLTGTLTPGVAPDRPLHLARITVSRPHPAELRAEAMELREALLPLVLEERRIGSASCSLLHVATGVLDAYVSVALPSWDTAAGHHLVRRSGGVVAHFFAPSGTPIAVAGSTSVVASLGALIESPQTWPH